MSKSQCQMPIKSFHINGIAFVSLLICKDGIDVQFGSEVIIIAPVGAIFWIVPKLHLGTQLELKFGFKSVRLAAYQA